MNYHFEVAEDEDIRQGDILRVDSDINSKESDAEWLVVLTADCDIAQNKHQDIITTVRATSAYRYLSQTYAPSALESERKRIANEVLDEIHNMDRKRDPDVTRMRAETVCQWIKETEAKSIARSFKLRGNSWDKFVNNLEQLALVMDQHVEGGKERGIYIDRFMRLRLLQKRKQDAVTGEFRQMLMNGLGIDRFFVPTLPRVQDIGFVINFRDLESVASNRIFRSEYLWKVSDQDQTGYVRIGRFSDQLRYAIAQRALYVFSRIGLDRKFEVDVEQAVALLASTFIDDMRALEEE